MKLNSTGWLGGVEGLHVRYGGAKDKLTQIDATPLRKAAATKLGMPSFRIYGSF